MEVPMNESPRSTRPYSVDDFEWMGNGLPPPDLAERMAAYVAAHPDMQRPLPPGEKSSADWIREGRRSHGRR